MPPKSAKSRHHSLSQKKLRKILQRFTQDRIFLHQHCRHIGRFSHLCLLEIIEMASKILGITTDQIANFNTARRSFKLQNSQDNIFFLFFQTFFIKSSLGVCTKRITTEDQEWPNCILSFIFSFSFQPSSNLVQQCYNNWEARDKSI